MPEDITTFRLGYDGFCWWQGVIESIDDPLKLGRVKVRILGSHNISTNTLSTYDLPWAMPINPVTSRAVHTLRNNDWVFGFYFDGKLGQQPMILGIMPSLPQSSD